MTRVRGYADPRLKLNIEPVPRVRRAFRPPRDFVSADDIAELNPAEAFKQRFIDSRPGLSGEAPVLRNEIIHVAHVLDFNYITQEVDLVSPHTDSPFELRSRGIVADTLTLTRVDSPISFKINNPTNPPITASKGLFLGGFLIKDVFVSNLAAAGKAEFFLAYNRRPDLGVSAIPGETV